MRIACLSVAVFLLLCTTFRAAAQNEGADDNAPTCLGKSQRAKYTIVATPAGSHKENYAQTDVYESLGIIIGDNKSKRAQEIKERAIPKESPTKGLESVVIEGLARFIERRARAELRLWLIDSIHDKLCEAETEDFFPSTCLLNLSGESTYLSIDRSYQTLVRALRSDIRGLPACTIYLDNRNPLGYLLQSLYRQYSHGGNLEELVVGLSENPAFTSREACTFRPALPTMVPIMHPFTDPITTPITVSGDDGVSSWGCGIVIPVLAYRAALEATHGNTLEPKVRHKVFLYSFLVQLKKLICGKDEACDAWKSYIDTLVGKWTANAEDLDDREAIVSRRLASLQSELDVFRYKRDEIRRHLNELKTDQELTRDEAVEHLVEANRLLIDQMNVLLMALDSIGIRLDVDGGIELADGLFEIYNAVEAHEYIQALAEFRSVSRYFLQRTETVDCESSDKQDTAPCQLPAAIERFNQTGGAVATLAEAKDEEDFADRLDTLASPIGAWKMRHEANLLSINAYGGVSYLEKRYSVPDLSFREKRRENGVFAPIGVQWSKNTDIGAWGLFVSLMDLGNIINEPESIRVNGGRIDSNVDSDFSSVFAPGVYITFAPSRKAPITIGYGYSEGPPGYREFERDGETFEVDRDYTKGFFIAVDIVLLPL